MHEIIAQNNFNMPRIIFFFVDYLTIFRYMPNQRMSKFGLFVIIQIELLVRMSWGIEKNAESEGKSNWSLLREPVCR